MGFRRLVSSKKMSDFQGPMLSYKRVNIVKPCTTFTVDGTIPLFFHPSPRQSGAAPHGRRVPVLPLAAAGRDVGVVQCGAHDSALWAQPMGDFQ